jgi:two-component system CheB/CheR fusion protein
VRRFVENHPIQRALSLSMDTELNLNQENRSMAVNITDLAKKELLNKYVPPSTIITDFGEILYIHGRLGKYLEPAPGKAKLNISDMAREGLKFELDSALQKAVTKNKDVSLKNLRVKSNGNYNFVNIKVKPLKLENVQRLLIVSFEDAKKQEDTKEGEIKLDMTSKDYERIRELENELKLTKERLNVTIEEMKSSNEELRSANEELQSMNERPKVPTKN